MTPSSHLAHLTGSGETAPLPPRLPSSGDTGRGPSPAASTPPFRLRVAKSPEVPWPQPQRPLPVRVASRGTRRPPCSPRLPCSGSGPALLEVVQVPLPLAAPPVLQKSFLSILNSCMCRVLQPLSIAPRPKRLSASSERFVSVVNLRVIGSKRSGGINEYNDTNSKS